MASDQPTRDSSADSNDVASFKPGLLLDGRYRLERPLGEGGMGTVWVGHQIALRRDVAIKSLRFVGDTHRERLRQEALALAAIRHPSVVQVFDLGEMPGGTPYIVMELVDAESLATRLERTGPLDAIEAVSLMIPLLEGLAVAHAAGVIHRDLKPENVLLTTTANRPRAKLVDFGIARVDRMSPRLTMEGGFVGTPAFMAPEQIRGVGVDERVDVWGAAALLYSLLTSAPPFTAPDILGLLRQVMEEPPSYPRGARNLDGKLWSILMNAMRKDPNERTPSVLVLRDELSEWYDRRAPPSSKDPHTSSLNAARASSEITREAPPSSARGSKSEASSHAATARSEGFSRATTSPSNTASDPPAPPLDTLIRQKLGDT